MIKKYIAAVLLCMLFMGMTPEEYAASLPTARVITRNGARTWLNNDEILLARSKEYIGFDYTFLARIGDAGQVTYKREDHLLKVNIHTGEEEIVLEGYDIRGISYNPVRNMCALHVQHYKSDYSRAKSTLCLYDMTTDEFIDTQERMNYPRFSPNGEIVYLGAFRLYWLDTGEVEVIEGLRPAYDNEKEFYMWDPQTNELVRENPNTDHMFRYDPYRKRFYEAEGWLVDKWSLKEDRMMYRSGTLYMRKDEDPDGSRKKLLKKKRGELSPNQEMLLVGESVYDIARRESIITFPSKRKKDYQGELP